MNQEKAAKIRGIVRIAVIVCAGGAALFALIFRLMSHTDDLSKLSTFFAMCVWARVFSIIMFAATLGLLVFDVVTKAFPPAPSAITAIGGVAAFVGNFMISGASSMSAFVKYLYSHGTDAGLLDVGSYIIIAAGVYTISYVITCFKKGI